ncbi:MAG: hypothetical protein NXI23_09015 [Bacteroidetes bacterium]|nr:hypothetical protein [Bacteroidota bacterium]MDF1865325.1 hypothetical protein [Saprospiraceae bacterium]
MKILLYCLLLMLFLISCKKEQNIFIDPSDIENKPSAYFPMEVGNYWVYEYSRLKEDGTEELLNIDTLKITGDTIIGADKFYFFDHTNFTILGTLFPSPLGIINHHITTEEGVTFLSLTQNDTLSASLSNQFDIYTMIETVDIPTIEVPAGLFDTNVVDRQVEINFKEFPSEHGNPRTSHMYFAKEIGAVLIETFFASSPDLFIFKLKDYRLN